MKQDLWILSTILNSPLGIMLTLWNIPTKHPVRLYWRRIVLFGARCLITGQLLTIPLQKQTYWKESTADLGSVLLLLSKRMPMCIQLMSIHTRSLLHGRHPDRHLVQLDFNLILLLIHPLHHQNTLML
jgi:hypothetical protein